MSEFTPMTLEQIEKEAEKNDCEVVIAQPDELQFDLDHKEDVYRFDRFLSRMEGQYEATVVTKWKSKSGNQHRVAKHPKSATLSVESRIALQAMGGSDEGREYAALQCYLAGSPHPVLLFKPKA